MKYEHKIADKPRYKLQEIECTTSPVVTDIDFLTQKINQETSEYGEAYPFAFFIRDENDHIIAGANGFVIYGEVYTDQLWVNKDYRGQGFARRIMDKVHEFGKLEGCKIATVQTMSFQGAKLFYEKLGYVVDFERPGYTQNSNCIFLKRSL